MQGRPPGVPCKFRKNQLAIIVFCIRIRRGWFWKPSCTVVRKGGLLLKNVFASGAVALCLLILLLLPAGAFAKTSVTFEYGNKNEEVDHLSWDETNLILNVSPGEMPDEIIFDLKGIADKTVTISLKADVKFSDISVKNQNGYTHYPATIKFVSGDAQSHQVQVTNLYGVGANNDKLIIGSGIEMTVNYISLGASGTDSYLILEDDAKLTFEPVLDDFGSLTLFNIRHIKIGENALLVNHSVLYDGKDGASANTVPTEITFTSTSPSTAGKFVVEVDGTALISDNDSITKLPQWLQDLIEQNGWKFDSHASLQTNQKTLLDQNGNIVTSFTVYNHAHVAGSTPTGVKAPTCTEDGYTGDLVCAGCGSVMQAGSTIPRLNHNYQNGVCVNCGAPDPDAPVPVSPPSTGDAAPLALWLSLMALTGACLIFAGIRAKRSPR